MTHHPDHELELYRDGDSYVVIADLPGFDRDDIDVRWHDHRLHITAEHRDEDGSRTRVYNQHVGFPHEIHDDDIAASYEDGLLEVTLPIAPEDRQKGTSVPISES